MFGAVCTVEKQFFSRLVEVRAERFLDRICDPIFWSLCEASAILGVAAIELWWRAGCSPSSDHWIGGVPQIQLPVLLCALVMSLQISEETGLRFVQHVWHLKSWYVN